MALDPATIGTIILAANGFGKIVLSIQQLIEIANTPPDDPGLNTLIDELKVKNAQQDALANELRAERYRNPNP